MRIGLFALAAGLLLLRFVPALPSSNWLLSLSLLGLLLLPLRSLHLVCFCWALVGPVSLRSGRWMIA